MDVLRASGSMPFVSKPVEIGGKKYLDGAVTDSIPFKKFLEMGYDRLIKSLLFRVGCEALSAFFRRPIQPAGRSSQALIWAR